MASYNEIHRSELKLHQKKPNDCMARKVVSDTSLALVRADMLRKRRTPTSKQMLAYERAILGNDAFVDKKWELATQFYTEAITLTPNAAEYYTSRGAAFYKRNLYSAAMKDLEISLKLDPDIVMTYTWICKVCIALGNTTNALEYAKRLLELNLDMHLFVKRVRDSVYELLCWVKEVDTMMKSKRFESAHKYLKLALHRAPACTQLQIHYVECLLMVGQRTEAMSHASHIREFSAECVFMRGLCLYFANKLSAADRKFMKALSLDGSLTKAKEYHEKCAALVAARKHGLDLYNSQSYNCALLVYTNALCIDRSNELVCARFFYNRALVAARLGAHIEVIEDCTRVLRINCDDVKTLMLRGRYYFNMGRFEESFYDYRKAWRLHPHPQICSLLEETKVFLNGVQMCRKDFYFILGVTMSSSPDEIKRAYHEKMIQHHPYRYLNSLPDIRMRELVKCNQVREAFEVLSDPEQKWSYDVGLV